MTGGGVGVHWLECGGAVAAVLDGLVLFGPPIVGSGFVLGGS